jgi:hypothetical protein
MPTTPSTPPDSSPAPQVSVKRFSPPAAHGVAKLVHDVYGPSPSYYPSQLYAPDEIIKLNTEGKLVSIIALDNTGDVVGHYALERPRLGAVAEASDAMVAIPFRHHHILEDMRVLLREEAMRQDLTGLVGYAVTNHTFTQKAEEHSGAFPCGIALGLWPRSFHNMPEPLTQRMSFAIYFKFLPAKAPSSALHIATPHQPILTRIYQQFGINLSHQTDAPAPTLGDLSIEYEAPVQTGSIHITRIGQDTPAAIIKARQELFTTDAKALTLEIPLNQPGINDALKAAESQGFFFSGLGPAFADGSDALILQLPREDLDLNLIQIDHPFAKELLTYADAHRKRLP